MSKHNYRSETSTFAQPWYTLTAKDVSVHFGVDDQSGLNEDEARKRLAQYGLNRLRPEKQESIWETFLEEISEPMILLLLATGILYAFWGELIDTVTIFFVIFIVVGVEIFNEQRAEKALEALKQLSEPTVFVNRGRQHRSVPAEEVVPGDIIYLENGQRIPADARLIESYSLD
ncbi:MAG: ATPase, partial [Nostocaceae cyanobacterium]|nr:ATPase [Nostocaceae cyanobacterium]